MINCSDTSYNFVMEIYMCVVIFLSGVLSQTTDYELPTCQPDTCPPTATCKDADGYIYCDCPPGKVGLDCEVDDPCMPNLQDCPKGSLCYGPCDPNIACTSATGHAHCRGCVPGYAGVNCTEDMDECAEFLDICANNGTCENTFGDFKCQCTEGWTGKECRCEKGTECDVADVIEETTTPSSADSPTVYISFLWRTMLLVTLCYSVS